MAVARFLLTAFTAMVTIACAVSPHLAADDVDWKAIWREARAKDLNDVTGGLDTKSETVPAPRDTSKNPGHSINDDEDTEAEESSEPDAAPGHSGTLVADDTLPPLSLELFQHGGSYMYQTEGDRLGWPAPGHDHFDLLRIPSYYRAPEPLTAFAEFNGSDHVRQYLPGKSGYSKDPRFVGAGSYTIFGQAFKQDTARRDAIGHQLLLDLDLRLTGTERFHVQWRPVGERATGGSWYQLNSPTGYVDNSTTEPDRYWFEAELHSLLGPGRDPLARKNTSLVIGKFPFAMHNSLLMNDEILGGVLSRNNIPLADLSNLNLQTFVGLNDVDTYAGTESQVTGLHATVDYQKELYELTYAYVNSHGPRDTHFIGLSGTKFLGLLSVAGRALFKAGDSGGTGDAHLVVLETNYTRAFEHSCVGIEKAVFFSNAFHAGDGWNSIGGANFNRLRTAFEVNPLTRLSTTPGTSDTVGVTAGVQLFRHHADESLIPEVAWERPDGDNVYGFGLRYLLKTGPQTYLEVLGLVNRGTGRRHDREGVLVSHTLLF